MTRIRGLFRTDEGGQGGGAATTDTGAAATQTTTTENTQTPGINFETLTEGLIKTPEEAQEFFKGFKDQYVPKTELEKFKDYIPASEAHANDFSKGIDELVRSKASADQIQLFVELSTTDISEMDNKAAIVKHKAMTDGLSLQDAALKVNSQFPSFDEFLKDGGYDKEDTEDVEKAKSKYRLLEIDMKSEGKKAKEFLLTKKKDIFQGIQSQKDVEAQQRVAQQEKADTLQTAWKKDTILQATIDAELKEIPFAFKEGDVDYSIKIPVSEEFSKGAAKEAMTYAIQNGIEPTAENIKTIVGQLKFAYAARNLETFIKSVALDMRSKTLAEDKRGNAGGKPSRSGDGKDTNTDNTKGKGFYQQPHNQR